MDLSALHSYALLLFDSLPRLSALDVPLRFISSAAVAMKTSFLNRVATSLPTHSDNIKAYAKW